MTSDESASARSLLAEYQVWARVKTLIELLEVDLLIEAVDIFEPAWETSLNALRLRHQALLKQPEAQLLMDETIEAMKSYAERAAVLARQEASTKTLERCTKISRQSD